MVCKILALGFFIATFAALGILLYKPTLGPPRQIIVPEIPKDFLVKALVFYGRRSRVSILDCYLSVRQSIFVFDQTMTDRPYSKI